MLKSHFILKLKSCSSYLKPGLAGLLWLLRCAEMSAQTPSPVLLFKYAAAKNDIKPTGFQAFNCENILVKPVLPFKIRKQRFGTILGLQRGEITNFVAGAEWQFKRKALFHPSEWAANLGFEYNFGNNILGYRAGVYHKRGRIALTYGGSLCYITDFENGGSPGLTPEIGFKLLGFHLTTGYNLLLHTENVKKYNTFQIGLVWYFPISSDTDVIRSKKKKKKDEKQPFLKKLFGGKKEGRN